MKDKESMRAMLALEGTSCIVIKFAYVYGSGFLEFEVGEGEVNVF